MSTHRWSILIVAASLFCAAPAAAQQEERADAERFFRAGESAYNAGQYDVAAQAFERAYERLPVPAIAFSTAQAHRLQYFVDKDPRQLKRAIELYRSYVDEVDKGGRRDDAITSLAELEPILLRVEAESGGIDTGDMGGGGGTQLMVTTPVEGANAAIDDTEGTAPLIRQVEPGSHEVRVNAPGYFPVEQTATAVEGEFIVVEIPLKPRPARVSVRTESGASIAVDGRPIGAAPLAQAIELPAGSHFVTVTRRGRRAWSREIEVERGETVELRADLHATGQRRASLWVLGASGASVIAAGVYGGLAWKAHGDAAELDDARLEGGLSRAQLEEYRQRRDDFTNRRNTAFVLVGAGAAIGVTGALMYFFDEPRAESRPTPTTSPEAAEPSTRPLSVVPVVTRDRAGLSVGGRF